MEIFSWVFLEIWTFHAEILSKLNFSHDIHKINAELSTNELEISARSSLHLKLMTVSIQSCSKPAICIFDDLHELNSIKLQTSFRLKSFSSTKLFEMNSMQQSLVFAFLIALCDVNCAKITIEQMQQAAEPISMVCTQKTKVSEDNLANLRAGKMVDQKELKCYVNCVLEMMQTVRKRLWIVNGTCSRV